MREESKIPYVRTVTENIANAIKSTLVEIKNVHINYIFPDIERKDIPIDKFTDYLMHFSQSGIFANTINWRYVNLFDSEKYLIEGDIGHNNGYELSFVIATKDKEDKDKVAEIFRESEE